MVETGRRYATILIGLLIAVIPLAQALPAPADDPVFNGEFELYLPDDAANELEGTPADECVGVGHQVFWGEETPQGDAEDAVTQASEGNLSYAQENVTSAIDRVATAPVDEALFLAGYGHCVYSEEDGYDVAWLNPVHLAQDEAVHWSGHDDDNVTDHDGDTDREILIPADPGSNHNLWQAWPSPHQAYTADFDALEFRVEDGTIPDGALVQVSLSATPLDRQSTDLLLYRDCALNFRGEDLEATRTGEQVSMSPLDAGFSSTGDPDCEELAATWHDATTTDEERRDILSRLRIVQVSFWAFHTQGPIVLDDIAMPGAETAAEDAPNLRPNPDPGFD